MAAHEVQDLNAGGSQTSPDGGQPENDSVDKSGPEPDVSSVQDQKQGKSKSTNWHDDPEYKKQQAARDYELSRLQRERDQARQTEENVRQRLTQLEDQAYGKDDYGKMQLTARRAIEERDQLRARLAEIEQERTADNAKRDALSSIAQEFGVPVDDLMEAKDWNDAIRLARKTEKAREAAKAVSRQQDDADNRPDLGGGGGSTAKTRAEADYEDAFKRKDSVAMARALRQIEGDRRK